MLEAGDMETAYYLRVLVVDQPGVLADMTRILGDLDISIEAIIQKEPESEADYVPVIIMTRNIRERQMDQALRRIEALPAVQAEIVRLRVEQIED